METNESLREVAERKLNEAQAEFMRDPTPENERRVERARQLAAREREREQQQGPTRPRRSN